MSETRIASSSSLKYVYSTIFVVITVIPMWPWPLTWCSITDLPHGTWWTCVSGFWSIANMSGNTLKTITALKMCLCNFEWWLHSCFWAKDNDFSPKKNEGALIAHLFRSRLKKTIDTDACLFFQVGEHS